MENFTATRLSRTARIRLNAAPATVFPLFTPLGERLWVAGWDPQLVYPASGEAELHGVFCTPGHDGQPVMWTIVGLEPERFQISYVRMAPHSHVAIITVQCTEHEQGGTEARVSYVFTGLTTAGNSYVAGFTEEHYQSWLQQWEAAINRYLSTEG